MPHAGVCPHHDSLRGNGSGKTTILNLIAQYPELGCSAPYNKTKFFDRFKQLSSAKLQAMMSASLSYARRKGVTERFRKYSNGENAFLSNTIGETGLYLLDEPKTVSPLPCSCIWRNS